MKPVVWKSESGSGLVGLQFASDTAGGYIDERKPDQKSTA